MLFAVHSQDHRCPWRGKDTRQVLHNIIIPRLAVQDWFASIASFLCQMKSTRLCTVHAIPGSEEAAEFWCVKVHVHLIFTIFWKCGDGKLTCLLPARSEWFLNCKDLQTKVIFGYWTKHELPALNFWLHWRPVSSTFEP